MPKISRNNSLMITCKYASLSVSNACHLAGFLSLYDVESTVVEEGLGMIFSQNMKRMPASPMSGNAGPIGVSASDRIHVLFSPSCIQVARGGSVHFFFLFCYQESRRKKDGEKKREREREREMEGYRRGFYLCILLRFVLCHFSLSSDVSIR